MLFLEECSIIEKAYFYYLCNLTKGGIRPCSKYANAAAEPWRFPKPPIPQLAISAENNRHFHLATPQNCEKQYAQIYALRQSGAFSAAIEQIEHLLHLYPEESEWYWQRLLCRYGMVYLPDIGKENIFPAMHPATGPAPISEDADYLAALQFAKPETEHYYEADATLLEQERLEECHPSDPEKMQNGC